MASEIFVDTSGFYALLVKRDDSHKAASRFLRDAREKRQGFATTDYVLDETATLLKARGQAHLLQAFFETVLASDACRVEWTDSQRFEAALTHFLKHADRPWSFTDCLSFCVMKQLRLREALTKDVHFQQAGFATLLRG